MVVVVGVGCGGVGVIILLLDIWGSQNSSISPHKKCLSFGGWGETRDKHPLQNEKCRKIREQTIIVLE